MMRKVLSNKAAAAAKKAPRRHVLQTQRPPNIVGHPHVAVRSRERSAITPRFLRGHSKDKGEIKGRQGVASYLSLLKLADAFWQHVTKSTAFRAHCRTKNERARWSEAFLATS
jgi:hypothetical protein